MPEERSENIHRVEVDCECGHTSVGSSIEKADENHYRHYLVDHDLTEAEREEALEEMEELGLNMEGLD